MDKLLKHISIRRISVADADAVSRIDALITKSPPKIDFNRIITEQVRKNEDASFIAEIDGKVAGYMISYIINGGFGLEKSAWIATLGVDPEYMGQGIGQKLAEEIFSVYKHRGISHVFTSVQWDSVDLLSFFKTLGFDRSDFINLSKELDSKKVEGKRK